MLGLTHVWACLEGQLGNLSEMCLYEGALRKDSETGKHKMPLRIMPLTSGERRGFE